MSGLELLAPLGILGLIAVPVVVVLHMRHTTPLLRPVPTLRFWVAAQPERTEQTRFRRPPLSLLLLLHLLIALLLALALTRPAVAEAWANLGLRTEPRHLILLLDGSTSMAARDTPSGRPRFEDARAVALGRLDDLREGDAATVVVLGTRTQTLEATDTGGFAALRERVRRLEAPGGRADLNAALGLSKDLLLPGLDDRIVLVSDGVLAADPGIVAELDATVELERVGAGTGPAAGNVAITDLASRAAPDNPDQAMLYARVVNFSDAPVTVPVALIADGIETDRREVTLAPGEAAEMGWPAPPGTRDVTVEVQGADALPDDDTASLVLRQEDADLSLRILLVSDVATPLARALQALDGAAVTVEPTNMAELGGSRNAYDLVVYENAAPPLDALPNAPLLLVNPPPAGMPIPTDGTMTAPTMSSFRAQDPLLQGVDLAGVTFGQQPTPRYVLDGTQTELVGAAEDGPLLFRGVLGGRPMVVLPFDLAQSNLPSRVAFPILIANIAAALAPSPLPAAVPLGDPLLYRPRGDAATVRVTPPEGAPVDLPLAADGQAATGEEAAAADRLRQVAFADTGRSGEYRVDELDAAGSEIAGGRLVVNAGHATESDLRARAELPDVLATARASGDDGSRSSVADLWPILVAVAVAVLVLEWLVALRPRTSRQPFAASYQPMGTGGR